jgi:anti-sigma B factor antagonist
MQELTRGTATALVETEKVADSRYLVRVTGTLDSSSTSAFERALLPLSKRPETRVTLDLADVEAIDSAALGVVLRVVKRLHSSFGDLEIVSRAGAVRGTFAITGLDRLIRVRTWEGDPRPRSTKLKGDCDVRRE